MSRFRVPGRPAALIVLAGCAILVAAQLPARALPDPPAPVTGNATHFDGLGSPYGGCGLPQAELETPNFVALNVYHTPNDYAFYPRPLPPAQADKIGMWNNGHNCGRWVQVTIGDRCTGLNDGAPGQPFCRNGSFVSDAYNGATLTMLVADSCGDANAWCRDDPYHLDLVTSSLNRFGRNGAPVGDLHPNNWNNRHVQWSFVPAPNYTGDIQIGFLQGAQRWWPAISVSRLPNGVHGIEYLADGSWQTAQRNGDMGQSFIVGGTSSGGTDFQIRVRDATDALLGGGRVYRFALPASCSAQCGPAYTRVDYTTGAGSPTPTATPTSTVTPTPTATPTPSGTPTQPAGGCSVTSSVTSSWTNGHVNEFTVGNGGPAPTTGWTVSFSFAGAQRVTNSWNALVSQTGQQVTVRNQSYNAAVQPGGTAGWGLQVDGPSQPLSGLSCAAG